MKTLQQLAKEFVCNVGCEPTENQQMEINALVMFGKAAFKECQPSPVAADLPFMCSECGHDRAELDPCPYCGAA